MLMLTPFFHIFILNNSEFSLFAQGFKHSLREGVIKLISGKQIIDCCLASRQISAVGCQMLLKHSNHLKSEKMRQIFFRTAFLKAK